MNLVIFWVLLLVKEGRGSSGQTGMEAGRRDADRGRGWVISELRAAD